MNDLNGNFNNLISTNSELSTMLFLEDETREIEVGIHEYEQGFKQSVKFDITVLVSGNNSPDPDSPDFLSYEFLKESLDSVLEIKRYDLLETIANEIIELLFKNNNIAAASVKVSKLEIPGLSGNLGCLITKFK